MQRETIQSFYLCRLIVGGYYAGKGTRMKNKKCWTYHPLDSLSEYLNTNIQHVW